VLTIPDVFEPELCKALIETYERNGGQDIGTLRDVNGQTVRVHDESVKRRKDCVVTDPQLLAVLEDRLRRRVFPEIKKSFQFTATQIERYVVACYDAQTGGFFRAHRDDQNLGASHRRFAVSIGLDDSAYEGGGLRFPEFGFRMYRPPTGGAVVFSCTLMHEVFPVTQGRRYAFLPFIYDDAAARLRNENRRFLGENLKNIA
jgi:predicted 2-oxoglutarate/Fe(II)-dependent dioxygenase YbiX